MENAVELELNVKIRPATREDFVNDEGKAQYGVPFWTRRSDDTFDIGVQFFKRSMILDPETQRSFKYKLENDQIWVSVRFFEVEVCK